MPAKTLQKALNFWRKYNKTTKPDIFSKFPRKTFMNRSEIRLKTFLFSKEFSEYVFLFFFMRSPHSQSCLQIFV